jgi:outer membrane immunogenic protein
MTPSTIRAAIAAAVLIAPAGAHAADLGRRLPPPSYSVPVYTSTTWTGMYAGINAGYGFGRSDWDPLVVSANPSPKGILAGLTVGYNYQTGTWVWGLEGDLDFSDIKGSAVCGLATCETKNSWLGTARMRLGYAGWSNWLVYGTFGGAAGNVKASNSLLGTTSATKIGWAAGVGAEYAMWSNWSVKMEYLYADLGSTSCDVSCGAFLGDKVTNQGQHPARRRELPLLRRRKNLTIARTPGESAVFLFFARARRSGIHTPQQN